MTPSGKLQRRHVRINHFNAKDSGSTRRNKRGLFPMASQNYKDVKNLMPYV